VWQLASRFGAIGAAAAWSARVIIDAFIQFALASRFGGVRYTQLGLLKFAIAALVMAVPAVLSIYLQQLNVAIIAGAIVCLFIYAFIVFKTMLEAEELSWITSRFNALFSRPNLNG
jgi:O-antigen/teichoic acid export membrane protein